MFDIAYGNMVVHSLDEHLIEVACLSCITCPVLNLILEGGGGGGGSGKNATAGATMA